MHFVTRATHAKLLDSKFRQGYITAKKRPRKIVRLDADARVISFEFPFLLLPRETYSPWTRDGSRYIARKNKGEGDGGGGKVSSTYGGKKRIPAEVNRDVTLGSAKKIRWATRAFRRRS